MTPARVMEGAMADGLAIALSATGNIRICGDQVVLDRWKPLIREQKSAILVILKVAANQDYGGGVQLPVGIDPADFEERAAIMEFDGGMTREEAERLALIDLTQGRTLP